MTVTELDIRWHRNFNRAQKRRWLKERVVDYLGGKCEICSYEGTPVAFDVHHPDSREKDFNVSDKLECSWEVIREELDKCHLLCCRCHRETHDGLHPSYMDYEDLDRGGIDESDDFICEEG